MSGVVTESIHEAKARLREILHRLQDPDLEQVGRSSRAIIEEGLRQLFETETDYFGRPWNPVQRTRPKPVEILRLTRRMSESAYEAARNAEITKDGFVVSMDEPHYTGCQEFPNPRIPSGPRRFLGFSEETIQAVLDEMAKELLDHAVYGKKK